MLSTFRSTPRRSATHHDQRYDRRFVRKSPCRWPRAAARPLETLAARPQPPRVEALRRDRRRIRGALAAPQRGRARPPRTGRNGLPLSPPLGDRRGLFRGLFEVSLGHGTRIVRDHDGRSFASGPGSSGGSMHRGVLHSLVTARVGRDAAGRRRRPRPFRRIGQPQNRGGLCPVRRWRRSVSGPFRSNRNLGDPLVGVAVQAS